MTRHHGILILVMIACLLGRSASAARLVPAFNGLAFNQVTSIQQAPGNSSRWFVAERGGMIKTFSTNPLAAAPRVALDVSGHFQYTTNNDSQQWGITSIAPSPAFKSNGYIYVAYNRKPTPQAHAFSYLSRFKANFAADPEGAVLDPRSEKVLLRLDQTTQYHHIGQILFGPGRYLYIGTGEGAFALPDARACRAQDPQSLYGKILRIDTSTVSPGKPYGIPASNPFPKGVNGAPEVYAMGFRNPWRFSFDRQNTNDLWLADVGEAKWEEINRVVKVNAAAGLGNYGWPFYEARQRTQMNCRHSRTTPPLYAFTHADAGSAVIGGYVYRGSALPSLRGAYVFSAFDVPKVYELAPPSYTQRSEVAALPRGTALSGFHEDIASGELYVLDSLATGPIYKLVP